jgi:hypothetical protein
MKYSKSFQINEEFSGQVIGLFGAARSLFRSLQRATIFDN